MAKLPARNPWEYRKVGLDLARTVRKDGKISIVGFEWLPEAGEPDPTLAGLRIRLVLSRRDWAGLEDICSCTHLVDDEGNLAAIPSELNVPRLWRADVVKGRQQRSAARF